MEHERETVYDDKVQEFVKLATEFIKQEGLEQHPVEGGQMWVKRYSNLHRLYVIAREPNKHGIGRITAGCLTREGYYIVRVFVDGDSLICDSQNAGDLDVFASKFREP